MSNSNKYRVVSLFSGCGGIDLGFKGGFEYLDANFPSLPFDIVWANDWDKYAMEVYNHNLSTDFQPADVRTLDFGDIIDDGQGVDVVTAGFPCQDFSLSGPRRGTNSERGRLYKEVRRALSHLAPKLFVAENVPGIEYPPTMLNSIVEALQGANDPQYRIFIHKINCADFGVPQIRQRILLIGIRRDLDAHFMPPHPVRKVPQTRDGSIEMPRWIKRFVNTVTNNERDTPNWMDVREAIDDLWNPSGTEDSEVADQNKLTHATIALGKKRRRDRQLRADLPSPTIRAQHHGHIEVHYNQQQDGSLRRLTIRECARIQGFPDSFEFPASASQAYVQIGNAMPPVVMHHWARAIAQWLSKLELSASDTDDKSGRSAEITSKIMSAVKSKGSKAERALGRAMWARGLRYRKHVRTILGTPDFAFKRLKIVVFCDGDFWHGRGWEKRGFKTWEQQFERLKSPEKWKMKIAANMERDRRVNYCLRKNGWTVLRFLESEIKEDANQCVDKVLEQIEALRNPSP